MRILITGTTGNSMPPPYAGIPKLMLLTARAWRKWGNEVAITFTYKPEGADDLRAGGDYFFEYSKRPGKIAKLMFLFKYFLSKPVLYTSLIRSYTMTGARLTREVLLYSAYGVYLDNIFETWKPDIVLAEAVLVKTFMAVEIANRRKIPIVADVYAEVRDLSMGENRRLNEDERKKYWVSYLNKLDLLIGLDNCAVEMKAYVPSEKLKVFWDTCDYQFYSKDTGESKEKLREHFKLPQKTFLTGAVGSFELRKGHDHLIRAVAILAKAGHDVGIVICGSLGGMKKWKAIADEEGVSDRCYFFSSISEKDLARLHRAIDLYTNLSNTQRSCSLDLALLEAMASGLPLVVYDTGALYKAVPGEENGYCVPMNDIPKAAEAILKIFKRTPAERQEMARKSRAIAEKVDIDITTKIKLGWFEELVKNYKK